MQFSIEEFVPHHIQLLLEQASLHVKESIEAAVPLNKNENSLGSPLLHWYNRYPDDDYQKLIEAISTVKNIPAQNIFAGNGAEADIDLLYRIFCEPGKSNVIICGPVYEYFKQRALINNVKVQKVLLNSDFQLDLIHLENAINEHTKIIWLCSPNDVSGIALDRDDIEMLLNNFNGVVVVDEAYINFSKKKSLLNILSDYPNLVILQSFSKAWGLAGLRLSAVFASATIIELMNLVRCRHHISTPAMDLAIKAMQETGQVNDMIKLLVDMRNALVDVIRQFSVVKKVYPSDANFLLVQFIDADAVQKHLLQCGIAVKNVSDKHYSENCLRITVGSEKENTILVDALIEFSEKKYE